MPFVILAGHGEFRQLVTFRHQSAFGVFEAKLQRPGKLLIGNKGGAGKRNFSPYVPAKRTNLNSLPR